MEAAFVTVPVGAVRAPTAPRPVLAPNATSLRGAPVRLARPSARLAVGGRRSSLTPETTVMAAATGIKRAPSPQPRTFANHVSAAISGARVKLLPTPAAKAPRAAPKATPVVEETAVERAQSWVDTTIGWLEADVAVLETAASRRAQLEEIDVVLEATVDAVLAEATALEANTSVDLDDGELLRFVGAAELETDSVTAVCAALSGEDGSPPDLVSQAASSAVAVLSVGSATHLGVGKANGRFAAVSCLMSKAETLLETRAFLRRTVWGSVEDCEQRAESRAVASVRMASEAAADLERLTAAAV